MSRWSVFTQVCGLALLAEADTRSALSWMLKITTLIFDGFVSTRHPYELHMSPAQQLLLPAAAVRTPMTEGMFIPERCLQPSDIAEAAMLALRTSPACVPAEITLRLTLSAVK